MRTTKLTPLALTVVAACLLAPQPTVQGQDEGAAATRSTTPSGSIYLIGPGDILEITVWRDPDLTRDVTVRLDGMITVPLLGDLSAAGLPPNALAETLAKELSRYVEGPRVSVGIKEATSARFYVLGRVAQSGEFPLSGGTTVLQGLALAGGFQDFAKLDEIIVIRRDGTIVGINYKRIADGNDVRQNIELRPGDTIVVP